MTRANVAPDRTFLIVRDIAAPRPTSVSADILERLLYGTRPDRPDLIAAGGQPRCDGIGFAAPQRNAHRTTDRVWGLAALTASDPLPTFPGRSLRYGQARHTAP